MFGSSRIVALMLLAAVLAAQARAGQTTWTWSFTPAAGNEPTARVTPIKYGKAWAYTVHIDDGPAETLTRVCPLLANYHWTDAPTGVAGGNVRPFVGDAAPVCNSIGGNSAGLDWDGLRSLLAQGWGVVNHGYWHSGYGWDPAGYLTESELRRELYWSQQIIGMKLFDGDHAPIHMVYPNGYKDFMPYLADYGLLSASSVWSGSDRTMTAGNYNQLDITRTYLDEGSWVSNGGAVAMWDFPIGGPDDDDFFIDFTHGIDAPGTVNYIRWQTRLATIEAAHGAPGTDEMWCAPSDDIIAYHMSAAAANVTVTPAGLVTLEIPDYLPGTALTIRIDGISPAAQMTAPAGCLLYRSGTTAWITTPRLNTAGSPLPEPNMTLVYEGPYQPHITLPYPIYLAAVRVRSFGEFPAGYYPTITLTLPGGGTQVLPVQHILDQAAMGSGWGRWYIFPTLPDIAPIEVTAIDIANSGIFQNVEIYAVEDGTFHPVNHRPSVTAGPDKDATLPAATVTLDAQASDDGEPTPPGALTVTWSKVSGPGAVTFANASSATTTATFTVAGEYVLRLTADDGLLNAYDDLTAVVHREGLTGSSIMTPNAWGNVNTHYSISVAFNNQPTWDGQQPVGGDTGYDVVVAGWDGAGSVGFIDLGPDWATWRIEQTWTKYVQWRAGTGSPYAELWWDDDADAVNDGVTETRLNFNTQAHDNGGKWYIDADASTDPVVPQGRYLMLKLGSVRGNDPVEYAFVGHTYTAPQSQLGDFNGDGTVTHGDYTAWADHYGRSIVEVQAEHPGWFAAGTYAEGAATITHGLYTTWADHFGETINEMTVSQPSLPAIADEPAAAVKQAPAERRAQRLAARRAVRLERAAARHQRRGQR